MSEHLFVYGTLMSGSRGPMARRLAREATSLGAATMRGRVYDLGAYPGFVPSEAREDIVHGELYALCEAAPTLTWLDAYEGDQYERVLRKARRNEGGGTVSAWIYAFRGFVTTAQLVSGGRWIGR